ncbi:MAG: hypothetical protein WC552_05955, partial [Candidatus Omnitrophota bacterium]
MGKAIILAMAVVLTGGCAKLTHLPQLLTIQAISDNKDLQTEYVRRQDESFERLREAVKNGSVARYPDQQSFLRDFGEPIFAKEITRNGQSFSKWLYRYSVRCFNSEKIYLYFDQD